MTSETRFATSYASMWKEITPLSDGYWAIENLLTTRIAEPIQNRAPKHLRGFVNELAFIAFAATSMGGNKPKEDEIKNTVKLKIDEAVNYINRVSPVEKIDSTQLDETCITEAQTLCRRLHDFFPIGVSRTVRPKFKGCGIINACEGDIVIGNRLVEVKAGDRSFRISDLRQLLTYSALAYAANELVFDKIGLFNPRTGMQWAKSLDEVCMSISGSRANDVLPRIVDFTQSASISR